MKLGIISFTNNGLELYKRVAESLMENTGITTSVYTKCSLVKTHDTKTNAVFVEKSIADWTKEQMKQADLIVVNFSQTSQGLDHFFSEHADVSEKVVYLIGSYQKDAVYNKKNIHRIYRIAPEKLGVVPYNPEFEMACREGKLDRYIRGRRLLLPTDMRENFFTELEHTVQMILERSDKRGGGQVVSGRDRQSGIV